MMTILPRPETLTAAYGRKLVAHLGGDTGPIRDDWCWEDFAREYPHLRQVAEDYFAAAKNGMAAYWMHRECNSGRTWPRTNGGTANA